MSREGKKNHKLHKFNDHRKSKKSRKSPQCSSPRSRKPVISRKPKNDQLPSPVPQNAAIILGDNQIMTLAEYLAKQMSITNVVKASQKNLAKRRMAEAMSHGDKSATQRQTVSIARLFKRAPRSAPESLKVAEPMFDHDLVVGLQDGLETAHLAIRKQAGNHFSQALAGLEERLDHTRNEGVGFLSTINDTIEKLSLPLAEEQIEIETKKDGTYDKQAIRIGTRITRYKNFTEEEDCKLRNLWIQWADIQDEYAALGIVAFGVQESGESASETERGGCFKNDMHNLNQERDTAAQQLQVEIRDVCKKTMKRTKISEKELDLAAKTEQERLMRNFLFG